MSNGGHLDGFKASIVPVAINHAARPFLASVENGERPVITVHASKAVASRADRKDLLAQLRETCADAQIRVATRSEKELTNCTSLEAFVRPVKGEIVFDPTGAFARSRALVDFAAKLRGELAPYLRGIFWSGDWRTLYVVFDSQRTFSDGKVKLSFLQNAELTVRRLLLDTCGPEATDFVAAVRLGFEAPPVAVIAVDKKSDWIAPTLINKFRRRAAMTLAAAVFGATTGVASAADKPAAVKAPPMAGPPPAVSAPNAKIAIMGGIFNFGDAIEVTGCCPDTFSIDERRNVVIGEGSISVPLGHAFGLQLDGAIGRDDDDHNMWGVGGHAFWRDPTRGLLGIFAAYSRVEQDAAPGSGTNVVEADRKMTRYGGEVEVYARDHTFAAMGGVQYVSGTESSGFPKYKGNDGFFGSIDLTWYANENAALSIGAEYVEDLGAFVTAGAEFQAGVSGLTFFAKGAYGEHDQYRALAGIRFYFGAPKTLKARHRYDDPQTNVATQSLTGFRQQYFQ